ncbi:MAG: ROK family protein [Clostridiaceae bacterium]
MYTIGIDIGGTNTRVALINKNEILKKYVFSTNINDAYANTNEILKIVKSFTEKSEVEGVGISCPGPLDLINKTILNPPNLPGWKNYKIVEEINKATGIPTYIENDANIAALAEYLVIEKSPVSLQFLTISTGIGAGFVNQGKIYRGAHGFAQEVFNIVVKPNAHSYGNYAAGAIESVCSGSGIYKQALARGLQVSETKDVFELAERCQKEALAIIEEAAEGLAIGISSIIQIMDPEITVISGSLVLNNQWMVTEIENRVKSKVHQDLRDKINIVLSKQNGDSGLIGAGHIATLDYNS